MQTQRTVMMEHLKRYEMLGFKMVLLHRPTPTGCSCGKEQCFSRGKHPKSKDWQSRATNSSEEMLKLTKSASNVGIATGEVAGQSSGRTYLFVLDVDDNRDGTIELKKLEEKYGELPVTMTVKTGNGYHLYFLSDKEVSNSVNLVGDGIDVRGTGGFVVAPPSLHSSGAFYELDVGAAEDPAVVPEWLLRLATSSRAPKYEAVADGPDSVVAGGRNDHLASLAGTLRRRNFRGRGLLAALLVENAERCVPPLDEGEVRSIAASADQNMDASSQPFEELLARSSRGTPLPTPSNIAIVLAGHPIFQGALRFNCFAQEAEWSSAPTLPWGSIQPGRVNLDEDPITIQNWLHQAAGIQARTTDIAAGMLKAAKSNPYDPLITYLKHLVWDGKKRLDTWLVDYAGAEDKDEVRLFGRKWLIGMVARGLEPGCKMDTVLVLEGPQGIGKSTLGSIIGGQWFTDAQLDLGDRYGPMFIQGSWLVELPELAAMSGTTLERTKAFLTRRHDALRRPYMRDVEQLPRRCVFLGTTNESDYLPDTANRRWWPVRISHVNVAKLSRDREQLLAEATSAFRGGEQWHLAREQELRQIEAVEQRRVIHPWQETIETFLKRKAARDGGKLDFVSTGDLLDILQPETHHRGGLTARTISRIMNGLDYEKCRRNGTRGYRPGERSAEKLELIQRRTT